MKDQARVERHSMAMWEGKIGKQVKLQLKKELMGMTGTTHTPLYRQVFKCLCSALNTAATSDGFPAIFDLLWGDSYNHLQIDYT